MAAAEVVRWQTLIGDGLTMRTLAVGAAQERIADQAVPPPHSETPPDSSSASSSASSLPPDPDCFSYGRGAVPIVVDPQLAVAVALRWTRLDAGLTQAQLAARAGVSQQQVAKLERPGANPSVATLRKIADALGARLELELVA
jgi:DNA-binding XRE family transcriptional regulator